MKHETLTFRFLDMSRGGVARLFLLLLLPCLSVIGVKAAVSNGGVKFNPGVRYSQWAINSRAHDFYANTTPFGLATYNADGLKKEARIDSKNKLDYVPGLVAKSMIEAADYYQSFNWSKPWFLSVKEYGDAYSNSVPNGGGSLDDLNAVKLYIGLFNNINATETDKNNAKTAISRAQAGLVAHNTNYSIKAGTLAGDAVVGGWFHKTAYNNQMWLDGAYMGSALLAQIVNFNGTGTHVFGSTTADWDMVFKQLNIVWNMCWNSNNKLMYHAFEANAGTGTSKSHADTWAGLNGTTKPYTFHSAAYWGRANAWYLMALVDVLEAMKNAGQESTDNYTTLKQHLADLAAGIAKHQDSNTGGWYQVMDKDASFTASSYNSNWSGKPASVTNYIETSATAIFAAAYFKAVRCGLLESTTQYDYKTIAKKAFEGLVNNYTYLDANGDMQIWGSCRSAGLGGGTGKDYEAGGIKYRDGSNEYYLLGYDVPMVKQSEGITEGKVLGGFIMAATEYERAYQNQDSKQILFAKDLAPSYDFTTTAGTLDATAYGSGDVTYQWYKDGSAIADAKSATYTPTVSGKYYCIATANGKSADDNHIQTSTTTVITANTDNGSTDNNKGKIKPVFLDSFKGITINLHKDSKNRTITVPLIYNGEDVSSYFIYTYTITPTDNTSSVTGSTLNFTPKNAGTYSVAVSATPDSDGTNDYSDVYDNPEPITFTLKVDSKYQTISVDSDPKNLKMFAGTTRVAPDLTVKVGTTTLDDTKYTVSWFSTSPGVVKVDATTGKIEAVSEGTAKIRVVVTGENLESTTALITIDVDDPAVYRVHANEEYKSQKTMWNQDENLSVTLGGWLFPNDVTNLWTTKESLSSTVEWNYDNTQKNYNSRKASWKITGFDYMVEAGDRQKNARQEKGSNCMPETTLISNADYTKKEYIVDPMFNVPCSGSFLVFQPKTNGTVVAHIYQNGVFDSKKKNNNSTDYQYRPQRRVFIMDEAGNFVSSDAHIESTTGKPNGKNYNLSDYKWDMGDKQSPTVDLVKKHFGLESFEMSETGFKNNVYENQLDQETAPNEAATKYPNLKGSRGWSVLADAPVTYKFKVKAGKSYYLYNFGSKIGFYGFSFDEDETKPVEDVVSYDDNTTNTIEATAAGHVAKVTVNRKMTKGIWTTCVLPFSLNRQQVDAIFGNTYSIGNENGTQILYFDRVEGNKVFFVRHAYNTIVANKPFLIKPSKKVESISTAAVDKYPYVTIEATKNENTKPEDWCTGNGYTWASSYSYGMTVKEGDGFISKDGLFKNFVGASGTLKGFRGYLKRLGTQTGAKPIMLQVVNSSNVDGDNGETTGIEDLIIDADGQLMPANGKVYNINGQLVSEDANSFQSLPSGIYIINGKKYIK